jgi:myo-inositol-1(or 4)-monophosphatase
MANFLAICEDAARAGGQVLLDWIGKFEAREKGPADLVTQADLASQEEIRCIVLGHFPTHQFVGEEGATAGATTSEFRWLVDPLDGTTNYVHQIPMYCTSIGLERRGELICGVVFDPVSRECYTAEVGSGAHLNGRKLFTSNIQRMDDAVLAVSFPPRVGRDSREIEEFSRAIVACQAVRRTGSTALNLCYLAAGRFDAYWGGNTKPWDVAAGAVIVREAGGLITNYSGRALDIDHPQFVAAATPALHEQMLHMLNDP